MEESLKREEGATIAIDSGDLLSAVCGANDGNLRAIEDSLGGRVTARGNEIRIEGAGESGARMFRALVDGLIALAREGSAPDPEQVRALAGSLSAEGDAQGAFIQIPHAFRRVYPKSPGQAAYIAGMRACELAFCVGPAGTGKTFLAVAEALRLVLSKKIRKIVLARPVVEAGESLGFLPGDLAQKISPYLRPLYDSMEALVPMETIRRLEDSGALEIAPLAYMRGRTLRDCAAILDEAQNATREQMKMFLTRLGPGARAVVSGDATQIDLRRPSESGLAHAVRILRGIEGAHFSFLGDADVARGPLVARIIKAYDESGD